MGVSMCLTVWVVHGGGGVKHLMLELIFSFHYVQSTKFRPLGLPAKHLCPMNHLTDPDE